MVLPGATEGGHHIEPFVQTIGSTRRGPQFRSALREGRKDRSGSRSRRACSENTRSTGDAVPFASSTLNPRSARPGNCCASARKPIGTLRPISDGGA